MTNIDLKSFEVQNVSNYLLNAVLISLKSLQLTLSRTVRQLIICSCVFLSAVKAHRLLPV